MNKKELVKLREILNMYKKRKENAQTIIDDVTNKYNEYLYWNSGVTEWKIEIRNDHTPYHEYNLSELVDLIKEGLSSNKDQIITVEYKKLYFCGIIWLCKPIECIVITYI